MNTQHLLLAGASNQFRRGDISSGLATIEKDLAVTRMMVEEADSLFDKMFSVLLLERSIQVRNMMIAHSASQFSPLAPLQPIDFEVVMQDESRLHIASYSTMFLALDDWLAANAFKLMAKPNRAKRAIVDINKQVVQLSQLDPQQLISERPLMLPAATFADYFVDPFWTIYIQIALPDYRSYILSVNDLNGYIMLSNLLLSLVTQGVEDDNIPSHLNAMGAAYLDPYTQEPLKWHPDARKICMERGNNNNPSKTDMCIFLI